MSAGGDQERGRTAHPMGGYDPGMFARERINTPDDFADVLGVPRKSIPLVIPTGAPCKSEGCPFMAILTNGGHCPAHQRSWYPLLHQRGGALHGPEFLKSQNSRHRVCDCDMDACKRAGYFPSQGPLHIPATGYDTCIDAPHLLSDAKIEALESNDGKRKSLRLYPWHFFPEHRELHDGQWRLKLHDRDHQNEKYYDLERRTSYDFPPPRNVPWNFLRDEYFPAGYVRPHDRWAAENAESKMPSWMLNMLAIDGTCIETPEEEETVGSMRRKIEMWRARALFVKQQKDWQANEYERKLKQSKDQCDKAISNATKKRHEEKSGWEEEKALLEQQLASSHELVAKCMKQKAKPLRYNDLYPGGILSKSVDAFTLFSTVELNDAFLDMMNYADGSEGSFPEGDGLCENLRKHSKLSWEEKTGNGDPPSMDPDSEEYKTWLRKSKASRKTLGMTWKDDYLVFCLYVRTGLTQMAVASLCGICQSRVSDVFYEWAQVLDTGLQEMFPRPTRKQMLQAYPSRYIEADGHARCYFSLDAFEIYCQASSNYNVASSTHSDYKGHTTVKFLGAADPIGCSWAGTVSDGSPGRASDVVMTEDTKVLRQVPFGHVAKVDKGFIVDNQAAKEGVHIDRPAKRQKKQVQQSSVDTSQTQKIGNTRIVVENVNGELKLQLRYLNVLIPCLQFGIISKIVRIGYLLQNFKKPIIQHRGDENGEEDEDNDDGVGRPCRAEVRWYGAQDKGLRDVRDNIRLWGLKSEIERHEELSQLPENQGKSPAEISDVVLSERLDLKKRQNLYRKVHKTEYDGGDL